MQTSKGMTTPMAVLPSVDRTDFSRVDWFIGLLMP